jgi:hypothetical protein
MDELTAQFLPKFTALAHERLRKAMETGIDRRHDRAEAIAHDLHALAGEGGLLGLDGVIEPARRAEEAARSFGASRAEADAVALIERIKDLQLALAEAMARVRSS